MAWNWAGIRHKGLRRLAWLVWFAAVVYGVFTLWLWYLNRPPHYTYRVPATPSPNALDDYHRAVDSISGYEKLNEIHADLFRHTLTRHSRVSSNLAKTPPPVPREELTALLQQNTEALRLIQVGLTHQYTIPTVTNETYQHFCERTRNYGLWRWKCQRLLLIRAVYCMNGDDPSLAAEALIDFIQFNRQISLRSRLSGSESGMEALRALALRLSVTEARGVAARLADFIHTRQSYAEALEHFRAYYLNYITANFRGGIPPEWTTKRWRLATSFVHPSPTQDRGVVLGVFFAYTIPNAQVPALADRYLSACIAAARQPGSTPVSFPAPPPDPFNYAIFGWDEPEKDRIAWALQTFKEDALLLTVTLEGYRKVHGAYPATLRSLVTDGWLTTLPTDAFTFKDTICYTRNGTGYTLYSRGPDGKDDGGKAIRTGNGIVGQRSIGDVVYGVNKAAEANSNEGRL
ncbi:MAG: hypothetical protein BWY25_02346 [Chloroflexi bacterium ADurb.Bin222]|nr:MAG: hypothetical protein BWY25_02346 [Chloroflexi bacterium ADurb.Bin222]